MVAHGRPKETGAAGRPSAKQGCVYADRSAAALTGRLHGLLPFGLVVGHALQGVLGEARRERKRLAVLAELDVFSFHGNFLGTDPEEATNRDDDDFHLAAVVEVHVLDRADRLLVRGVMALGTEDGDARHLARLVEVAG